MASIFDAKHFNTEVFQKYIDRIPNPRLTELLKSRAIRPRPELAQSMRDEVGGNYLSTPLKGLISGSVPMNYDGNTNITPSSTETYLHSRVVVGRANAWAEYDFSYDITGGENFMENIAEQINDYWNEIDQDTIVSILKGIFSMTGAANLAFVNNHTLNIVDVTNKENELGLMDATTLNTAIQKASGDQKGKFSLVIMHSTVSTHLENLNILTYRKFNDENGMQREVAIADLNGRLVLIDDSMPVEDVAATYAKTSDQAVVEGKTYYTRSGSSGNYTYTKVDSPVDANIGNYYEMTHDAYTGYTTFVLGDGAIEYTDCGVKVPYEMDRNPAVKGGQDLLYSRQRKCWAPYGISFTMQSMASASPTNAELETGANWELVKSAGSTPTYINHKTIPIARIISRG